MKFLIINGPNLNLLQHRDPQKYGSLSLVQIESFVQKYFNKDTIEFYQSNKEGEIIDKIQGAGSYFDGIVINPGGFAHTSVAIRDALELCRIPKIEVHLSNLAAREDFRQNLITASVCNGYISGLKEFGYIAAITVLKEISA